MPITTYGRGIKTDAMKRAEAERAKEKKQIAEKERLDTAKVGADAEAARLLAEAILEREEGRVPPPVDEQAAQAALAQREADEALIAELLAENEKNTGTFYRGMKMAFGAALKGQERCLEVGLLAGGLGISNPLGMGVMGLSDGVGVIQDKLQYEEAILEKFARLLRGNNGEIDRDYFENPGSWM